MHYVLCIDHDSRIMSIEMHRRITNFNRQISGGDTMILIFYLWKIMKF